MAKVEAPLQAVQKRFRTRKREQAMPSKHTALLLGRGGWWRSDLHKHHQGGPQVVQRGDGEARQNVILERARFNCRCQWEGESAEQYITALYSFIETCEYGALHDEMLRDRIVVGIRDAGLSERLQLDPELMLEKVIKDPIVLDEVRHAQIILGCC